MVVCASAGGGPWQVRWLGQWRDLDEAAQEALTEAKERGDAKVFYTSEQQRFCADLQAMSVANVQTGRNRALRYRGREPAPGPSREELLGMPWREAEVRYQVFLENTGWQTVSSRDEAAIQAGIGAGQRVFDGEVRGRRVRYNLEDLTRTDLVTGEVAVLRSIDLGGLASAIRRVGNGGRWRIAVPGTHVQPNPATAFERGFESMVDAGTSAAQSKRGAGGSSGSRGPCTLKQEEAEAFWLTQALADVPQEEKSFAEELVRAAVAALFMRMALSRTGEASKEDWLHYWLLEPGAPSAHALGIVQETFRRALAEIACDSTCGKSVGAAGGSGGEKALGEVLAAFRRADTDNDLEISVSEMRAVLQPPPGSAGLFWPTRSPMLPGARAWLKRDEKEQQLRQERGDARRMDEERILNYFGFVAELVGRQSSEVWLLQYDMSRGFASWAGAIALGRSLEGIWHTGVMAFGKEYWYGGLCFESEPGTTPFGQPQKRILLGSTVCTKAELWAKIDKELSREYTRGNYDVLSHNCNHFSEELTLFLLNKRIPDEVRHQTDVLLDTTGAVAAIRPVLNQLLGGFSAEAVKGIQEARAADLAAQEQEWADIAVGSLVTFSREGLPAVTAEVLYKADEEATCHLWWWEPRGDALGSFLYCAGASKMQVSPLGRRTARSEAAPAAQHERRLRGSFERATGGSRGRPLSIDVDEVNPALALGPPPRPADADNSGCLVA